MQFIRPFILSIFVVTLTLAKLSLVQAETPKSLPQRNPFLPYNKHAFANKATPHIVSSFQGLPLQEEIFWHAKLNYVQAAEIKEALQALCRVGKISTEPLNNNILFYGPQQEVQILKQAITSLDTPTSQVTLQAKVISIDNEASKNLGVNWSWDIIPQRSNSKNTQSDSSANNGRFKFWRGYSFNFGATLNALQAQGKIKILATPSIVTLPGKEASIFIGDHIPVQTEKHDSSGNYTSTEYLDAGIKLKYTPILDKDNTMVTATVHTEVSTPSLISEVKNYKITSRTADTNVRMKSGETLVIGGLINEEEQRTLQKIPLLGDIPILGNLFKNRHHAKSKTEVVLLLTPYITPSGQSPAIYSNLVAQLEDSFHNVKEKELS